MKVGVRRPSVKRSLRARTTGRAKRAAKRAVIPYYGRKGMGLRQPRRAAYNRVYKKTSFGLSDIFK